MLGPDTMLVLAGGKGRVRLSYVLEDDSGCRKGLTVRRLLPDPSPSSDGDILPISQRPGVHIAGRARVGILDTELWEREPLDDDFQGFISGGVLTCVFTIVHGVKISAAFRPAGGGRIVDLADCAGKAAYLVEGKRIGTILDQLNYIRWNNQCVYPLLRLERSDGDLVDRTLSIRNGAMVATDEGALMGIIVSISDGGKHYGVAPIGDVLEWHRLRFLRDDVDEPEQVRYPAPPLDPAWDLRPQVNPELRELIGA